VLILATCGILVLADWSQSGRFQFGFPFISESVRVVQQVPATLAKGRDAAFIRLEQKTKAIAQYQGPVEIAPVQDSCGSPVPPTHLGVTKQQIAAFVASNPINQLTLEQATQTLGAPLCQVDPFTLLWVEQGSSKSFRVTFNQQGDRLRVVVGFNYDELPATPPDVTTL
jgi:hypothetical protein